MIGKIKRLLFGDKALEGKSEEETPKQKELASTLLEIDSTFDALMVTHDRLDHSLLIRKMYEDGDLEYRVQGDLSVITERRNKIDSLNTRLQVLRERRNRLICEIEAEKGTIR